MIITHCSKPNFDRQKPTLGKMYETNSDGYHNFFLHCKKYFRLISFWESLPILNHEAAPTVFFNIWDPLSKLGVTVEVRSFDGKYLLPKKFSLKSQKYRFGIQVRDPGSGKKTCSESWIPDPGVKKAPWIRNTDIQYIMHFLTHARLPP